LRYASEMNIYFLKVKRFKFLMKMAKQVRVFKIQVPWDIKRLNEVHNVICEHSEEIE